jgi:Zn-dependent peptidase ImmA (M78 family)/transcriptional regulator with XRE-family HTH domain
MNVNPEMVVLARESRGLSQTELAERIGASQAKISKIEGGALSVSETDLQKLSRVLHYPSSFFKRNAGVYGFASACPYHRKQKGLPASILNKIHAVSNIMRMHAGDLLRGVVLESPRAFPAKPMDVDSYQGGAEEIARRVRTDWMLPRGPIRSMVAAIEDAGGIILRFPFGTTQIDAVSLWPPGLPPLIFTNHDMKDGARLRFTLAHELGHLIMRNSCSVDPESEADQFASEFLMPKNEITPDLAGLTFERAARLKLTWKVSMRAIIRRAKDTGAISERKYRSLNVELNSRGYAVNEPMPIEVESQSIFKTVIATHFDHLGFTVSELAKMIDLFDDDFAYFYLDGEIFDTGPRVLRFPSGDAGFFHQTDHPS